MADILGHVETMDGGDHNLTNALTWMPRPRPRKFGKILEGDAAACNEVRQKPYNLVRAWDVVIIHHDFHHSPRFSHVRGTHPPMIRRP